MQQNNIWHPKVVTRKSQESSCAEIREMEAANLIWVLLVFVAVGAIGSYSVSNVHPDAMWDLLLLS